MIRVVIDPGVYVSAFVSPRRASPARLLAALIEQRLEAIVCPHLIAELDGVLRRPKFARQAGEGRGEAYVALVVDRARVVEDVTEVPSETADPADDYLVALARAQSVDGIVSGDAHLLDAELRGMPVWTPREVADRLDAAT